MEDLALVATVPVAKGKALFKSGSKKGKLRPGCRFKGKRTFCTPEVASRLKSVSASGGSRRSGGSGRPLQITAKTPQGAERQRVFQALLEARKFFKIARDRGDCGQMRHSAQKIVSALQYMGNLPVKPTKKNPSADQMVRNRRYIKEMDRVKRETMSCALPGAPAAMQPRANTAQANAANRAAYEEFMRSRGVAPSSNSDWQAIAREAQRQENIRRIERMRSEGRTGGSAVSGVGWRDASESECLKKNGRLKKGCKHGGRGKFLKKVG